MEERDQGAIGECLNLISKDCDGDNSLKDPPTSGEESQTSQGNSDDKLLNCMPNIGSNGVDSEKKAVIESTAGNVNSSPELVSALISDESQRVTQMESVIGDKTILETDVMLVSNEENSEKEEESANQSVYSNLRDTHFNKSPVLGNDQCNDVNVTEAEIGQHLIAKDVSDQVKNVEESNNIGAINCEKEYDSRENVNKPYEEKELILKDSTVFNVCKPEDAAEIVSSSVSLQEKLCIDSSVKNSDHNKFSESGGFVCENDATKNKDISDFQDLDALMDVDNEDISQNKNPLAEPIEVPVTGNIPHYENTLTEASKESCNEQIINISEYKCDEKSRKADIIHGTNHDSGSVDNYTDQSKELFNNSRNDAQNSQIEKSELCSTEIVNCTDETVMELSDNDKDNETNNIDVDKIHSNQNSNLKKQNDENSEEMDIDKTGENELLNVMDKKKDEINYVKDGYMTEEAEAEADIEKQILAIDENEALIQPGGSEEETITGDTESDESLNDTRGKDAEICIIPDDVTLSISLPLNSDKRKEMKGSPALKDKPQGEELELDKYNDKDDDQGSKNRPVRVAAKMAVNKIKSLADGNFTQGSLSPHTGKNGGVDEKGEECTSSCTHCGKMGVCKFEVVLRGRPHPLCSDQCYNNYRKGVQQEEIDVEPGTHIRKCSQCHKQVPGDENTLSWETMDFCNEECLGKYQTLLGSNCANCKGNVPSVSLGKYCVRFGYDVKQFCTSSCLEEYKKGLKVCSYCQKDISTGIEGFLAPVGDKGQFKDFCTQSCMEKYEQMSNNTPPPNVIAECAVCSNSKPVKLEVELDNKTQKLCSEPCFAAFKFVNNISEGQCDMCKKYFDKVKSGNFSIYYEDSPHSFCCKTCMNVYILANRKIVPCNWCKVKKYNFDMIKKVSVTGQVLMMCSLNCLTLYQVSVNAVSTRRTMCDFCLTYAQAKYHLTMSDASVRNFCCYTCVMSFQSQYPKQTISLPSTERLTTPIPTGGPKKIIPRRPQVSKASVPVISSVQSLASPNGSRVSIPVSEVGLVSQIPPISQPITIQSTVSSVPPTPTPQVYQQIITKPAPVKQQKNKSVLCKPYSHTKGVSCRPHPCMKETQTDESLNRKFLIPIPVPIYVPAPMHMFASPFPVAVPFPLPVPVPIFIPTTRNSAKGILKEIKKIQEKIPTDPFEAELLMMAEMVAGEKKQDPTDSESDDGNDGDDGGDGTFSPENVDTSNTFGEDMLQMALKMATELEEPAVDMESVLTSNTITPSSQPAVDPNKSLYVNDSDDPDQVPVMPMGRGRKRSMRGCRNSTGGSQNKRGRRISGPNVDVPMLPPPDPVPPPRIEVEKPDANMCLKYTFGVNAWRHWVMQKNAELEKVAMTNRKIKLFKPELLQLTADELNFSLCLFVKEVRKPNGTEYAPDTIYYLCLGIQQYLFENGRIDNIFTDSYYEKFTDCLDEVAKKFAALYNDSQYIVTRVEEEHLWESKQLGAHSPHVLLSTLMFFNTKHFNLVTVEEHMQLSFSHIMKHWKRNPNGPGIAKVPGSRNVLLRFYPPQSALEANSRKKKVYEQQENEDNPLRCPVKLYEFYLSKCPESVKTRNDVFYLLPERSCVPDSPVWYSTMALGKEPLTKMLHRVKMVKEINIALLTC